MIPIRRTFLLSILAKLLIFFTIFHQESIMLFSSTHIRFFNLLICFLKADTNEKALPPLTCESLGMSKSDPQGSSQFPLKSHLQRIKPDRFNKQGFRKNGLR